MNIPALLFRHTHIFAGVLILGILSHAGCSGGGDGGDEVIDTPATVPDLLNYDLRQANGTEFAIDQNGSVVTITSTLLTGSYRQSTEEFTLLPFGPAMSVSAQAFLDGLYGTDFNDYVLQVNKTLTWTGDASPTDGEFDIRDQAVPILVRVNITPTGVDLAYYPNGDPNDTPSASSSLTWDEFDNVFDNDAAPDYQQIAAFANNVLHFMYEQSGLVIQALELINENDIQLEETGSVEQSCDTYSPLLPSSTPAVSYDPGLIRVNWYDANNDTGIGPGDTVYLGFIECWDDDETSIKDTFYDGTINLVNYTEVESAGVLIRIGFEPSPSSDGGINYEYFKITETETNPPNVIFYNNETLTLTGGFSMVFTSP